MCLPRPERCRRAAVIAFKRQSRGQAAFFALNEAIGCHDKFGGSAMSKKTDKLVLDFIKRQYHPFDTYGEFGRDLRPT